MPPRKPPTPHPSPRTPRTTTTSSTTSTTSTTTSSSPSTPPSTPTTTPTSTSNPTSTATHTHPRTPSPTQSPTHTPPPPHTPTHSDQLKGDKRYEYAQHLDPLTHRRFWRTRSEPDLSLASLRDQFDREHVRPHKRLAAVYPLWLAIIGENLTTQTRLESLNRGVLKIIVANPSALYAIDRILRDGGERQLITAYRRGTLRKISLKIGPIAAP